jgi:hypothetical protein
MNTELKKQGKQNEVGNIADGLSTLKGYYVIGNRTGCSQPETIHFQRKGAIARFLENTGMTWEELQKYGWRVYKVNVVFQPCK